ncbi:MAG: hypothetical protein HQK53_14320 [Oligoflexia bacterium]|nr:hypothetical protein [Oligoflexia bacterium]
MNIFFTIFIFIIVSQTYSTNGLAAADRDTNTSEAVLLSPIVGPAATSRATSLVPFSSPIVNFSEALQSLPGGASVASCGPSSSSLPSSPVEMQRERYDPDKKYLIVEVNSGLYNRVSAVATAFAWAAMCNRELILIWKSSFARGQTPGVWKNFFSAPSIKEISEIDGLEEALTTYFSGRVAARVLAKTSDSNKITQWKLIRAFALSMKRGHGMFSHTQSENGDELYQYFLICQGPSSVFYMQEYAPIIPRGELFDFSLFRQKYVEFYQKLTPVPEAKEAINGLARNFEGKRVVGIHHRSFNPHIEPNQWQHLHTGIIPPELFEKMDEALRENPNTYFFIATDNLSTIAEFEQRYPEKILHYPHERVERDNVNSQLGAVIDATLLGKTEYIIGTQQSTLSDEAAVLTPGGKVPIVGSQVVEPNKWCGFMERCVEEDLINMIKAYSGSENRSEAAAKLKAISSLYSRLPKTSCEINIRLYQISKQNSSPFLQAMRSNFINIIATSSLQAYVPSLDDVSSACNMLAQCYTNSTDGSVLPVAVITDSEIYFCKKINRLIELISLSGIDSNLNHLCYQLISPLEYNSYLRTDPQCINNIFSQQSTWRR